MRCFYTCADEQFPPGHHVERIREILQMGPTTVALMNVSGRRSPRRD